MSTPFIDIHIHSRTPEADVMKIVSLGIEEECPELERCSYGIHPWDLDKADFNLDEALEQLKQRLQAPQAVALGEAGLDKAHPNSYERQIAAFEKQIGISEAMRQPLIIHDVRSHNEIISLRKQHKATQPWIIHGFNGTEQDIRQLTSHGIYISVGEALLHPERKISKVLKTIDLEYLFLETDTASCSVKEVYAKAASLLEIPLDVLAAQIFCNFARIFK